MGLFNVNNSFWQFLNKMADQFVLSLLWLLCSLPLVTAGAATASFLTVSMKLHRNEEGRLSQEFFSVFRECFCRSTLLGLTQILVLAAVAADLRVCYIMGNRIGYFLLPVLAVLGLLVLMAGFFIWPLVTHSDAPLIQIWKTAAYIVLSYLPHALAMLALAVLGAAVACTVPSVMVILPGVVVYQYARVYTWIFDRDIRVQAVLDAAAGES
nr:YesL family protein [uncultured Oscillibacter sp.]